MPVILVIIIMVAWLVILGPNLWRRRSHTVGGISSISNFHHQLRVLKHSAPEPLVAPAYRLRTVDGAGVTHRSVDGPEVRAAPKLTVVGADQLPRPALAFLGEQPVLPEPGGSAAVSSGAAAAAASSEGPAVVPAFTFDASGSAPSGPATRPPDARARARRRRRDTLGVLGLVFLLSLMIGFVATAVWALTLVSGLALAAYVALLVRMRQRAEERERKLHYLRPAADTPDADTSDPRRGGAVRIGGRYAHPSNQAAVAR